jgi:tetratricopeptide (TPR) repeat protein
MPDAVSPAVDPDAKSDTMPSLVKALTAKTVPMRSMQAPPLSSVMPTTAPMPSRPGFKSASPPPASLKEAGKVEVPAPPTPPAISNPASELEVPTVKLPKPGSNLNTQQTLPLPPSPPPSKPIDPPVEPARSRRFLLPVLIGLWAVLAAFMLYYIWSPYHAATALQSALDGGDPGALDAAIDFPAVRDSLKEQVKDQIDQSGLENPQNGATASVVLSMLDKSIDHYVTPQGISVLVNKSAPEDQKMDLSQLISPDVAAKTFLAFSTEPVSSQGLASPVDFVENRNAALLHLQFHGLGWKLKRIDLQPNLGSPGTSNSGVPLLAPVVDTYLEWGAAKSKSGDTTGALADYTQALAIDPQSSEAYNNRALLRQANHDLDGAIKDYTQALALNPQLASAYDGRANAKSAQGDLDGAIADYTQAVNLDPTMAAAFDSRGNAKILKDDLDGAVADFTQAITIDPTMANAYSDRGFAQQANGNLDGAIADYTQALAIKPKMAGAYYNRGLARQAQGNLDAAVVDFSRAIDFDPKIADAWYSRGNAESATGHTDEAIADFTQAINLNPRKAAAYGNRGLARQIKGDLDGALADFTSALALDPKITSAYLNKAVIELQKNDLDDAISDSTQALYLDPKNATAFSTRGFAKLSKGNLDGALTDLTQFCSLAPRDHEADHARLYLWLIAKAQNTGGDADQALSSALESSWNSTPDDFISKTAEFFLGNLPEADYLAAAASPDAKTDQAQHCRGWYFAGMKRLLTGDKKGAIEAFQQCLATQQKDFSEYVLAQAELQALMPDTAPVPAKPVLPAVVPAPLKTP